MITYIKRKDLEVEKYDACIENSLQSRVYAFSWYLDIVADNWDVLVLDDYKAVMPIPWKKKYFIRYVHPPLWLIELGVFSLDATINFQTFFKTLSHTFRFVESRLNTDSEVVTNSGFLESKEMQVVSLEQGYDAVFNNYRKDRKKDLAKANKLDLTEKWKDSAVNLITLFKNNVGKRTPNIQESDYIILKKLMATCIEKRVGEVLSIYDDENHIVASGFFLKHKKTVTILVSSTDFKNRKNGANTFLIDRAIQEYEKDFDIFNFGGSSMQSIAKYFLSFGGNSLNYQQIKLNTLPFLFKLFKK
jgi:hypothetical protein